jgi:predicted DNA-binding transcriptional regulator YafY
MELTKLAKARTVDQALAAGSPFPLSDCLSSAVRLPAELDALPGMIEAGARATLVYLGGSQGSLPRPITPTGLIRIGQASYLVAYCHREKKEKQFRLDRILEVRRLPTRAPRHSRP